MKQSLNDTASSRTTVNLNNANGAQRAPLVCGLSPDPKQAPSIQEPGYPGEPQRHLWKRNNDAQPE